MSVFPLFNENYFVKNKIKLPSHSPAEKSPGNQIFHYCSENLDTAIHPSTNNYIRKNFKNATIYENDASILLHSLQHLVKNNLCLEFGVCTGKTINFIAAMNPQSCIYGFDSFQGMPEDWQSCVLKESFALLDKTINPPLLNNVSIIEGLYEDTLPLFSDSIGDKFISFLHIDCCTYNSTKPIFQYLKANIQKNTVILFDEYFNYKGWENHEYKAFSEFIEETKLNYKYIAYNRLHQQVAVQVL